MMFPESESNNCSNNTVLKQISEDISAACTSCSLEESVCTSGLYIERKIRMVRQANVTRNVLIHFKLVSRSNENIVNQLMGYKKGLLSQYLLASKDNLSTIINGTEEKCPPGKMRSGEHCLSCSIGWYHNVTADICIRCPEGEYQPMQGMTLCLPCNFSQNIIMVKGTNITRCKKICLPSKLSEPRKMYPQLQCEMGSYNMPNEPYLNSNYQLQYSGNNLHNCLSNPCANGGICVLRDQFPFCNCLTGYTGSRCEIEMSICKSKSCVNGGTCVINSSSDKHLNCICLPRFTGSQCQVLIDECLSTPCVNGGQCFNTIFGFKCICPPHFDGLLCEQLSDFCLEEPCMEGSTCISGINNYTCLCSNGWTGRNCEIDPCYKFPCKNGFCELNKTTYICHCDEGYYGNFCEKEYSPCDSEPCLNNGTCTRALYNDYKCQCRKNNYGRNCENYVADFTFHFESPGVNDYAEISTRWKPLHEVSICFWLKVLSRKNYGTIFSYATREEANTFTIVNSNGFVIFVNGDYVTTNVMTIYDEWQSICILWETDGKWSIFIQSKKIESGIGLASNTTIAGGGIVIIGQEQDSIGNHFNLHESFVGDISDLQMWNRLLSYADIKEYSLCNMKKEGNVITWFQFLGNTHGNLEIIESNFCQKCGPPPSSIFTSILINEEGRNAVYICNEGYFITDELELRNSTDISCLRHGKWQTPIPKCKPIHCGFPGYLPNGQITGRMFVYPHKIFYKCREPYYLVGSSTRQCLSNGLWSGIKPTCQVGSCPKLMEPDHGTFWFNEDLVHFECNVHYSLYGEHVLTCLNNNTWSYPLPVCIPKGCLTITKRPHSSIHINGTNVEVTCIEGYNLIIQNLSVPRINWDCKKAVGSNFAENWQCILDNTTCVAPLEPENGLLVSVHTSSFKLGMTVEMKCNKGFAIQGQNFTRCQGNNLWSHSNRTVCKRIDCGTPRQVPFADLELLSDGKSNNIALVKCLPGYQGFGNLALKCQEDGRWSHFRGKCIRISCGKPQILGGGILHGHSYLFMDKVSVICPPGFYLNGEEILTCGSDGKWDSSPTCGPQPIKKA